MGTADPEPGDTDVEPGRKRARQAGVLVFGKALSTLSDALVPILVVRLLDKTDVGILTLVLVIYATASLVLTTGFPAALFHFLPTRERPVRAAIVRRFGAILSLLGFGLGVLLLSCKLLEGNDLLSASGSAFDAESLSLLAALCLYPVGDIPVRLLPNLLVIEERPGMAAATGVLRALGTSLFTIVPIALGLELEYVLLSLSAFGVVEAIARFVVVRRLYATEPKASCPVSVGTIFRFSIPLGLTDIVSLLNNRLDRYLVGTTFPAARLAEYQAGAWQVPVVNDIPYSVGRVYAPDMARLFGEGKAREAIALWRTSIHKVSAIVVPLSCVFLVAAEECMELLFTAEYAAASNVFRAYAVLTLGRVAAFGTVIVSTGKPRLVLHAAVFTIASNLLISVPLLYAIGFLGPAIGTALSFIPSVWFYCRCIAKAAGLRAREIFPLVAYSKILALGLVSSIPAALFKLNVDLHPGIVLPVILVMVLGCYGLLGTLTGQISRQDWTFVRRYLRGRFSTA